MLDIKHKEQLSAVRIESETLNSSPTLLAMDFLNDISNRFPEAISLAAGRPPNEFIDTTKISLYIDKYIQYRSERSGVGRDEIFAGLGQYGPTAGIIRDLVATFIQRNNEVEVNEKNVLITNGFQEALIIELMNFSRDKKAAVIAIDPTYVGLTGAAITCGLPLFVVPASDNVSEALAIGAKTAIEQGFTHLCAYLIPDFDNPTGKSLSEESRKDILHIAATYNITLFEDVTYRLFNYDSHQYSSLLKLDKTGCVIQLGSFSKIFMPGTRIGYIARNESGESGSNYKSIIKSFVSVCTSHITQAIVGGFLLDANTATTFNADRQAFCKNNRDIMLSTLEEYLEGVSGVSWSVPNGGFFLTVNVPFEFGEQETIELAKRSKVIVTPMQFFSPTGSFKQQIRLCFSANKPDLIRLGTERFAMYVKARSNES
ncbi:hypothetical protein TH53_06880 [Pedobacter lusitanus]|uniref:Aminotransferase class I/classII large domain-containing protein n=1 Tax=Pedobacter lusitanus TaxID=1503925 RepID=A0A0D0GP15_9SPHI|nr:PLP-dependent aminotransferase family protein [Pedobacter lusitanus]KIO77855.1 hypothetical protein TH53_06880 [Pedobacter lusitanus]